MTIGIGDSSCHPGTQISLFQHEIQECLDGLVIFVLHRIYQYQQFGYSFSSVERLLHAMGGDGFLTLANQTLEEAMLADGFSQVFLNDIVAPITRVNYGQSVRINGFVGMFARLTPELGKS